MYAGLREQTANENGGDERSWKPNIPRRRLDGTNSTNRDNSNRAHKPISCTYKVDFLSTAYNKSLPSIKLSEQHVGSVRSQSTMSRPT